MPATYPSAWLLLTLPFVSAGLIAHVHPLRRLAAQRRAVTLGLGGAGLVVFFASLLGLVPQSLTVTTMILGAAFAGLSCFWTPRDDGSDGDDWRRWSPDGDDPPPDPVADPPLDWGEFDRARAGWERRPVVRR